jgi:hypothetical protein
MTEKLIADIRHNIAWLDKNAKSDNTTLISQSVAKLNIQAMTLAEAVTDAYAAMNELEDDYKIAVDEFTSAFEGSIAAAEPRARATHAAKKREWTKAKNTYKTLDVLLDRIDKISDSQRQRVSVIKQADMKHL